MFFSRLSEEILFFKKVVSILSDKIKKQNKKKHTLTIKCTETAHNCNCGKTCKIVKMYIRQVIGPDIEFIKQISYLAEVTDLR